MCLVGIDDFCVLAVSVFNLYFLIIVEPFYFQRTSSLLEVGLKLFVYATMSKTTTGTCPIIWSFLST
jgi:hypothetical protein